MRKAWGARVYTSCAFFRFGKTCYTQVRNKPKFKLQNLCLSKNLKKCVARR